MPGKVAVWWRAFLGAVLFTPGLLFVALPASAATLETLYRFCSLPNCADGAQPNSDLLLSEDGDLYGYVQIGSTNNPNCDQVLCGGGVFRLKPGADGKKWREQEIYEFCQQANCADGSEPGGKLVQDRARNLYGILRQGGANAAGAVFRLTPNAAMTAWTETLIYSFCAETNCTDGAAPFAGLVADRDGNLYGTTSGGGSTVGVCHDGGCGTVFQLSPDATRTVWTETVIYTTCSSGKACGNDTPTGPLLIDRDGVLFGTQNNGRVFSLTFNGDAQPWLFAPLGRSLGWATDLDGDGNIYGVGYPPGGSGNCHLSTCGFVFQLLPSGKLKDLHDVDLIINEVVVGQGGKLYGTTRNGVDNHCPDSDHLCGGSVFMVRPNTGKSPAPATVLFTFDCRGGPHCPTGSAPIGGVTQDKNGVLYGTTAFGGNASNPGSGTVFKLTP